MTYRPMNKQEELITRSRVRGMQALRLCVAMMVSDRAIHDAELGLIYKILNEDSIFENVELSDDELIELISKIQKERSNLGLNGLIKKYSKISHFETRLQIYKLLDKVMLADGVLHNKELETISILKDIWD